MTLGEKQRKFTKCVACLIFWACDNGYELTFGEATRPSEMQLIYVAQGKSKTLKSKHMDRLAIDFNLFINGAYITDPKAYEELGAYWKSLDIECIWGGDWGWDANHFQYGN